MGFGIAKCVYSTLLPPKKISVFGRMWMFFAVAFEALLVGASFFGV